MEKYDKWIFDVYFEACEEDEYTVDLMFSDKYPEERRKLLVECDSEENLFSAETPRKILGRDFLSIEVIKFFINNTIIRIPSIIDGLQIVQRTFI